MSTAKPLTTEQRRTIYRAQNGHAGLTPRQERRLLAKLNAGRREFPSRPGRLRRRFDRQDGRKVKARATALVAAIRARRGF